MNPTIAKLALSALIGQRRGLLLLALPVLLLALSGLIRVLAGPGAGSAIVSLLGYSLVLPLIALLAASAVLGPEVDDGSVVYLLAKPVNRFVVGFSKFVIAWLATMALGALPLLVAGLITETDHPERGLGWMVGGVVAGTAYTALFLALSAITRHAVVIGLLFVLLWEGLLGGLLSGIKWLSISAWGAEVAGEISTAIPQQHTGMTYALVAAILVTVGGLLLTGDRLRSFSLRGDE